MMKYKPIEGNEESLQDAIEFSAMEDVKAFTKANPMERNSMALKPPKPGELIYCRVCGKPMYPKDFSTDARTRKREFKWQTHIACLESMENAVDRSTPGLLHERKMFGK